MASVEGFGERRRDHGIVTKIATETEEAAYDGVKREFRSLETEVSEPVAGYFARVHVIFLKLTRHQVTTPARDET